MAERGQTWSDQEIAALLAKWADETIQAQLLGAVLNVVPYRAIADELRRRGYERDYKQRREKIKAMKKTYKEMMDSLRSGVGINSDNNLADIHPHKLSVVRRDSWSFRRQRGSQSSNTIGHLEAWSPAFACSGDSRGASIHSDICIVEHSQFREHTVRINQRTQELESGPNNGVEKPGPSGTISVERPGPWGLAVWSSLPLQGHVQRKGRWQRWKRLKSPTESFLTIFVQFRRPWVHGIGGEDSGVASRTSAKGWQEGSAIHDFNEMFFNVCTPLPIPYCPPTQPLYPFSPVPPPILRNDKEEDDEE